MNTLTHKKSWTKTNLNDLGVLMTSVVQMSRAHEESERKSDLIKKSWAAKRNRIEDGEKMTSECPSWLALNSDRRSFSIVEERAESIRRVYELALQGIGVAAITSRANREDWPLPGSAKIWHLSRVKRLLSERKVLGEYQPHLKNKKTRIPVGEPIQNYYPSIIDENDWLRVQSIIERRAKIPRRTSITRFNFLSGILKCSCGASVTPKNIGKGLYRYYCMRKRLGQSDCLTITTEDVETAVINCLRLYDPIPHTEQKKLDSEKIEALNQKLIELKKRINRIADFIENGDEDVGDLRVRYNNLKREQNETNDEILLLKEKIAEEDLPVGSLRSESLSRLANGSNEDRQKLHTELLRAIKKISIEVDKFTFQLKVEYKDGHVGDSLSERTIKTKDRIDISKMRTLTISESSTIDELIEFQSTKSKDN
ncbi:MAG: recombinase family protein [Flavobacterium sp.]